MSPMGTAARDPVSNPARPTGPSPQLKRGPSMNAFAPADRRFKRAGRSGSDGQAAESAARAAPLGHLDWKY
jgi:hypothetical protein